MNFISNITTIALEKVDFSPLPQAAAGSSDPVKTVIQIVFGLLGAVAVVYVIIGGLGLITSNGNPQSLSKARNTIIFAAVGLLVAVSAEAVVSFVVKKL